jgi:hypothetical protein
MQRVRVEKKVYHPREDRYGEPLPLDPRELPFPLKDSGTRRGTSRPR